MSQGSVTARAKAREHEVVVAGVRSPIVEVGPAGAREAVVLVHGSPTSSRDWESLIGQVGGFARAVALDLPGFGRADKPSRFDYSLDGYADFLAAAIAELGIARAHIVAHDIGGPIALRWAVANPAGFASIVLINTGLLSGYRGHPMARIWRTPLLGELVQLTLTRSIWRLAVRRGNPRLPREFVDRIYDDYDAGTRATVLKLYRSMEPVVRSDALAARLRELDRPALVVWGSGDPYIGVEHAEGNRAGFPQAEVVMLAESGHWPMADDPDGFAAAAIPFLRRQLGSPGGST